ncbi:unnamed protein product [Prunus armeniaca]|uniref:Reverse transcriptase domain-containing protein n=1 Tax=Prunus armeniaca TaxID=36596 RepID=A0A6J5XWT9_PRUAR|nr:unnamed protein product [Prunus armeniaca]
MEEKMFWKQKSRVQWLNEREKNTSFFHSKMVTRRRQNHIRGLEDWDEVWMEREADIHRIAGSYLNDIFTSCHPTSILKIVGSVEPCITEAEGTNLLLPVTPEEVFEIVKHMNPSKSLGLDSFTRGFFQHYWQVVGDDVFKLVKSFFSLGTLT